MVQGECAARGSVRVSITHKGKSLAAWRNRAIGQAISRRQANANDGRLMTSLLCAFSTSLKGIPVGGPYDITFSVGNDSVTVKRVSVGDVWLLAGQSNMQGCGNMNEAPAPHPKVHAMYMDDHWDVAREPIHFLADSPDPVHYEAVGKEPLPKTHRDQMRWAALKGVGPGIFFGREMARRSGGVPQGLLCTAHGGTSMEQWDPAKKSMGGRSLYGSMLRTWRKTGQPVAAILWYQGESDCNGQAAPLYTRRMKRFVSVLRRDFQQPGLPFLLVQIGKVFGSGYDPKAWNSIQDQQLKLKKQIRDYDVVSTIDLPLDDTIHVGSKGYERLGRRLARLADRMVYGNREELPAPELASISTQPTAETRGICQFPLDLTFKNVVGGLQAPGLPSGFTLVDANHDDQGPVYKITLKKNRAILETNATGDTEHLHLMYGWGTAPYANITDSRDMAIPVFQQPITEPTLALSPYIDQWLVSRIQNGAIPVHEQPPPKPSRRLELTRMVAAHSFVDQHLVWAGKQGQCYFFSKISLNKPMKLNVRLGYDGPIKLWIDDKTVFADPNGTNPAIADKIIVPVNLGRGTHRLSVAMDLHGGLAWGFFLRFNRRDITKAQLAGGGFTLPVCSLEP